MPVRKGLQYKVVRHMWISYSVRKRFTACRKCSSSAAPAAVAGAISSAGAIAAPGATERPAIEADIEQVFLGEPVGEVTYEPAFLATVQLHYAQSR